MKFIPTRQEGLRELRYSTVTETGVDVWDIMRFMNGDNTATEFEYSTPMVETRPAQAVMATLIPAMTLLTACKESTKHWKVKGN